MNTLLKTTILERYIGKTLVQTIMLVLLLLMSIGFLIGLINEMHYVGRGEYGLGEVFIFVLYHSPAVLYQLFPMICLIGSLLGLGLLAQHRELVCMRASGLSIGSILLAVGKTALLLILLLTLLGEVLAPQLNRKADEFKALAKHGVKTEAEQSGVWLRDGSRFIHIGSSQAGPVLYNVTEFAYDHDAQLKTVWYSQKITYRDGQWHYENRRGTHMIGDKITLSHSPAGPWQTSLEPRIVAVMLAEPNTLSLKQLHEYIHYLQSNNLRSEDLERNFWGRIYQPLMTLFMVLVAVPLIFGPLRQATMGLRIVGGVLLGFVVYLSNELVGHLSIYLQLPIAVMVIMPSLLVALLLCYWLKRV